MRPFESHLSHFWWTLLLRGVVAVLFGLSALAWPGITLTALVLLFGAFALVDGIAAIIIGFQQYGDRERWWATLIGGIIGVAAGFITFMLPGITALALLTLIAFWAIMRGAFDIVAAIRLRHVIQGEFWLALGGALSVAFGVLMLVAPGAGALAVVWWIAAFALAWGVILIVLAFRLRRVGAVVRS
jgi:uncharacterized membrane protein HdeD (DUF308 family)